MICDMICTQSYRGLGLLCYIINVQCRGGTNRENLCRFRYRVRKLKSGPGRVYLMQNAKITQHFQFSLRLVCHSLGSLPIGNQAIDWTAIIRTRSPQKLCT